MIQLNVDSQLSEIIQNQDKTIETQRNIIKCFEQEKVLWESRVRIQAKIINVLKQQLEEKQ